MSPLPKFKVTVRNYRSFSPHNPITVELGEGVVFILGLNNAGKSNLLRLFAELRLAWDYCAVNNLAQVHGKAFDTRFADDMKWDSIANHGGDGHPITVSVSVGGGTATLHLAPRDDAHTNDIRLTIEIKVARESEYTDLRAIFSALTNCIYVPSTRTIRHTPTRRQNLVTGEHFVAQWKAWSAGTRVRHREVADKLQQDLKSLFGYTRLDIRPNADESDLLVTTEDGSFGLSEYGDGLSHFVIVLANAAMAQPELIFIDEPENSLHPRLQITFVQTLARYAGSGLVATSHSIGLARSVADQILFLSRDRAKARITPFGGRGVRSISDDVHEMGYSQFVELGGAGLLLVEGRTDIKAYREILRHLGLDQSFIVLSFGGGTFFVSNEAEIFHELDELKRLNAAVVGVIYDGGRTGPNEPINPKCRVFHEVCERLGYIVHATDRYAIDNYVSQSALDTVLGAGVAQQPGPFEKMGHNGKGWSKTRNWQLFASMSEGEIAATDIGQFILNRLHSNPTALPRP